MAVELTEENTTHQDRQSPPKRRNTGLRWLILLVLLAGAILVIYFFGWLPRHKQTEAIDEEAQQRSSALPRLSVARVRRAPATSELMVPGTTLAYTEAAIYARAAGYVSRRLVDIGDHVRKGQLLATVDAPDLDRQVAQARSSLAQSEAALGQVQAQAKLAELTWNRWKVLVAKGVFSRQEGDQQEANYRVAQANVNAAESSVEANRESLNRLVVLQSYEQVTAPFSGVVTARNVDVGTLIGAAGSGLGAGTPTPGSTGLSGQSNNQGSSGNVNNNATPSTGSSQGGQMFAIAAIDRLRVLVSVPEAYTSSIRVGQKADLLFQDRSGPPVAGRVTRTSSSVDQNTRTLLVEVQVANNGKLVPGMYVNVNFIQVKATPALLVSGAAIVVRGGRNMVAFVDNGNAVHLRTITLGRDYGEQTEVTSGLTEGEAVVLNVTDQVQEGLKVEPQFQKENAPAAPPPAAPQGRYGDQKLGDTPQKSGQKAGGARNQSGAAGKQPSSKQ